MDKSGPLDALDNRAGPRATSSDLRGYTSRQLWLCNVHKHGTDSMVTNASDAGGAETRHPRGFVDKSWINARCPVRRRSSDLRSDTSRQLQMCAMNTYDTDPTALPVPDAGGAETRRPQGGVAGGGPWVALDHRARPCAAASDLRGDTCGRLHLCKVHTQGGRPMATHVSDAGGAETRRLKDGAGHSVGRAGSRRVAPCGVLRPARRHQQVTMVVHRAQTWHRPHGDPCIRRRRCGNTTSPGRAAGGGPWVALDHGAWPCVAVSDLRGDTSRQCGLCTVHRHGTDPTALLVADVGGRDTRRPHVIFWMSMRQVRSGLLLGRIGVAHTLQSSNSSLWFDIRATGAVPVSGVANP